MPKLLITANSFEIRGGVEISVLPWLDELDERKCDYDFVLCRVHGRRADMLIERGTRVFFHRLYYHYRGFQIPNPVGILSLAWRIHREEYDAIIGLQPPGHYFARLAALLSGRSLRIVVMEQLSYLDRGPVYVWLDRLLNPFTDLTLCVSESLRQELLAHAGLPHEKSIGIPHGISIPSHAQADAELLAKAQGRLIIGFVARLTDVKRHRFLVDCFEKLIRDMSKPPVLMLAGDVGEDPGFAEEIRQRNLDEHVWVMGHFENIHSLYKTLDIFVHPSVLEGFGLVWAEAMAHGIPVISSGIAPMTEFLIHNENALLFEPDNEAELTNCLERLIQNPELRAELGAAGKQMVAARLDYEAQKRKYADAFLGSPT